MEVTRLVNDGYYCRFEVQREENWIYTRPTRSSGQGKVLELFCDKTCLILQNALALDVDGS